VPHWLLEESDEHVVTCIVPGTPMMRWSGYGRPDWIEMQRSLRWEQIPRRWAGKRIVRVARRDDAYAINLEWDHRTDAFVRWYVNLQAPYRRRVLPSGIVAFDMYDHLLDVVIHPDGRAEVKDEEELAEAERQGMHAAAETDAIRAEARRAIEGWPAVAPRTWLAWRPDPSWPLPSLPDDWETA
jgi:hypothetical protein